MKKKNGNRREQNVARLLVLKNFEHRDIDFPILECYFSLHISPNLVKP